PAEAAKSSPPPVPATVPKPFKEDTAGVTLTPEAEQRLAVRMGTVERKSVPRVRVYGGEVVVPPGRSVAVAAPLAGTLRPAAGGAGSQRLVDEAQGLVDVATKTHAAAVARRDLLTRVTGEVEGGTSAPIPVEVPEDGVIRTVSALPGQTVPSGAALFEVLNLDVVWVRVPVYAGDLPELDTGSWASVGGLAARPGEPARPASFVTAPPSANPASGTVDVFYQTLNWDRADPRGPAVAAVTGFGFAAFDGSRLVPGQRVGATLPLADPRESLTVAWSAVVFDIHGGAWVYEKTADRTYTRRRVVVRYVTEGVAVLESGPAAGTKVVTAGAAEL